MDFFEALWIAIKALWKLEVVFWEYNPIMTIFFDLGVLAFLAWYPATMWYINKYGVGKMWYE